MISIFHIITGLASHALVLSLIIVMTTMTLGSIIITASSLPPLVQNALADHGQEIVITPKDSSFAPVSSGKGGNQVKVVVNYAVHDPMIANDLVKAVMKVYSPNGTLLKTSSSPTPFPITDSYGTTTLATTLKDPSIDGVIAKIVFTNPIKTETISNELPVNVGGEALSGALQDKTKTQVSLPSESELESESEVEAPVRPPSEDIPSPTESAIASSPTEEEQQVAELEELPVVQGKQQVTSIESAPQTTTDNPSTPPATITTTPPSTTSPTSHIAEEICGDGIDNDGDALIDFSDGQCNRLQSQQQRPMLQQEQTMAPSLEICDDDLDNDNDGKVDSRDEECSYITNTSSFPSPGQGQPVTNENTEREIEDTEEQLNEDLSEESAGKENSDGEENKEDDRNEDEEGEEEDTEQESDDEDNGEEDNDEDES
jgi:hypothetical protein